MNKKSLSEQEIRSQYIRPALVNAGWQRQDVRIREEFHLSQAETGDFKHFGDKMTWVQNREVNKAFQIYLALYQAVYCHPLL